MGCGLAFIALASVAHAGPLGNCPAFAPGDTQPVYLPPGCTLAAPGYWRDADAENAVDAAVVALRRCAANEARAAGLLRDVPEPPSRVSWALLGAAAGALIVFGLGCAR